MERGKKFVSELAGQTRMGRVYNPDTMTYSFSDGTGVQTRELVLRRELLREKAIADGLMGIRNAEEEMEEVEKWFRDYENLNKRTEGVNR